MELMSDQRCRLCLGSTKNAFCITLLGRFAVDLFLCDSCGSLQTERPYWLADAYQNDAASRFDVWAASRAIESLVTTIAVRKILGLSGTVLDFGGGDGLLCRHLRDVGVDAYVLDRYREPVYAKGFSGAIGRSYETVTAFEVLEHFVEPAQEIATIFASGPQLFLFSTELYRGQKRDWQYLAIENGQHVFFYSPKAIDLIAAQHGYHALHGAGFVAITAREPSRWQSFALRNFRGRMRRLAQALVALRERPGIERDFAELKARKRG